MTNNNQLTSLKPPFLLSLLCVFSFVFFGLISILFLVSLFYSGSFIRILNEYIPEQPVTPARVILLALAGFLLHFTALTGAFMMLKMRKTGYLLFGIAALIISIYQLFQDKISFLTGFIYILLVILFGMFYKRFK